MVVLVVPAGCGATSHVALRGAGVGACPPSSSCFVSSSSSLISSSANAFCVVVRAAPLGRRWSGVDAEPSVGRRAVALRCRMRARVGVPCSDVVRAWRPHVSRDGWSLVELLSARAQAFPLKISFSGLATPRVRTFLSKSGPNRTPGAACAVHEEGTLAKQISEFSLFSVLRNETEKKWQTLPRNCTKVRQIWNRKELQK